MKKPYPAAGYCLTAAPGGGTIGQNLEPFATFHGSRPREPSAGRTVATIVTPDASTTRSSRFLAILWPARLAGLSIRLLGTRGSGIARGHLGALLLVGLGSLLLAQPPEFGPPTPVALQRLPPLVDSSAATSLATRPSGVSQAVVEEDSIENSGGGGADRGTLQVRLDEAEASTAVGSAAATLTARWLRAGDPELDIIRFQTQSSSADTQHKPWYERYTIRGYAQFRLNETVGLADDSAPAHHAGDRSVGEDQNFLIRRARLILAGDISEHLYVYLQPDFASTVPGSPDTYNFAQIRDWYADLYIDESKVYRVRLGQSKVPYGWENMQSSSNRIPIDRSDSLNSAARNERDLGAFFYWTPEWAQDFFKEVLDEGLKGSGNYGVFGLGAYNGQGGSLQEQNDDLHFITRLTWPITLANYQHMELGVQAYTGRYTVLSSPISPLGNGGPVRPAGTLETGNRPGLRDERVAGTLVWYPQPLGFQAEWNVGRGPALNDEQNEVVVRSLHGGYVMTMYRLEGPHDGIWFPFVRWNYFSGGYKAERNAPLSHIDEWELGFEWQLNPQMEFVTTYSITDRTNTTAISQADVASYRQFNGQLLRFQFQVNY